MELIPLAFAQPWLLGALLGLPLLWWLLRVTPPSPRRLGFPAIRLLLGLTPPEETPARTPWWLLLLRLLIAACIILALAQPLLNPAARLSGSGPLLLVVDDDWAAARQWERRLEVMDDLLAQAERQSRPVMLLTTTPPATSEPIVASGLLPAHEARQRAQSLQPKPWAADRRAALAALRDVRLEGSAHAIWLSNGFEDAGARDLAERLQSFGRLNVLRDEDGRLARLLLPPHSEDLALVVSLRRVVASGEETANVLAVAEDGRLVGGLPVTFAPGETTAEARLELPVELRNRIARLAVEGETQAGAVQLLDERWRRRPVGLVAGGPLNEAQPLLSELYYLERALGPFTELRRGPIGDLLKRKLAVIALADVGSLPEPELSELRQWIEAGGMLLRFAGPRLAEDGGDELLPMRLRGGGRTLGGVLTWDSPARLAAFDPDSPFAGLAVPRDVLINSQVLAEPSLDLGDKTWARLSDGTPLVTAERRGEGWVVLVHTTANTDWSNLALSGLFVDMLRRMVAVSQGVAGDSAETRELPPIEVLDGFGRLVAPAPTVLAVDQDTLDGGAIGPQHPPGYYGSDSLRRAHNLARSDTTLNVLRNLPPGVTLGTYARSGETDLKPWLLAAALILALSDLVISLYLRGLLGGTPFSGAKRGAAVSRTTTAAALLAILLTPGNGLAQSGEGSSGLAADRFAAEATAETRLAYVRTGVPAVDNVSRAGLFGLTRILERRTSVEPGAPMEVNLLRDEIAFFPLLYWPVTPEQRSLDDAARRKVNSFLENGGTILFDLREAGSGVQLLGRSSQNSEALRRLTEGLDMPPLEPVPPDHVLTKSFYLMQEFPGRFSGGALWVGATEGRVNDGVASVIIGSNDWAGAWALNEYGRPLFAVVPGGERQRELAYRVGVNIVMYALTGNYKADQVHVPFILERLGQ
ncbi:MAG: DUF4159 domain-containing protein [Kiloniellales bacterium]